MLKFAWQVCPQKWSTMMEELWLSACGHQNCKRQIVSAHGSTELNGIYSRVQNYSWIPINNLLNFLGDGRFLLTANVKKLRYALGKKSLFCKMNYITTNLSAICLEWLGFLQFTGRYHEVLCSPLINRIRSVCHHLILLMKNVQRLLCLR